MAGVEQYLSLAPTALRAQLALAFKLNGIENSSDMCCIMGQKQDASVTGRDLLGELYTSDFDEPLVAMWEASRAVGLLQIRKISTALPNSVQRSSSSNVQGKPSISPSQQSSSSSSNVVLKPTIENAASLVLLKTTIACLSKTLPLQITLKPLPSSCGLSSKSNLAADWEKTLSKCRAFLLDVGSASPRFTKLFGLLGTRMPSATHLAVQDDSFRFGSSSPPTINGYLKEVKNLFSWTSALSIEYNDLGEFDIASFLKDQCARGPSVPLGCYRALIWGEKVLDMNFFSSAPTVVSQSNPLRTEAAALAIAAKMATTKMLRAMEDFIRKAPTAPLQVYSGVMCALAHGVLRWKDLQRSDRLHLTADALVAVTWRMKKKKVQQPWAALRVGLTGIDWAGEWISCLEENDMPGEDFIVLAVSRDMTRFTPRIGTYGDGVNTLRALLVLDGMEARDAMQFTLHSWRHLFPTAARQLRLPEHEQVEIGHWATGSSMPRRYDSAACVTELIAKTAITDAFRSGWMLAEPGCVPCPPPVLSRAPACVTSCVVNPKKRRKTSVPFVSDSVVEPVKVVHFCSGKVHIWHSGIRTLCSKWKCGSPGEPSSSAIFATASDSTSSASTDNCKDCFGERLKFLRVAICADDTMECESDDFET